MKKAKTYSNIHSHSNFSLLDGHSSPEEILQRCNELGIQSTCVTEHGNQFSWYYYAKLQEKYPNVKINYGVEFYYCLDHTVNDPKNKYYHLIILAKNKKGLKAINELITMSNFEGFYYKGRIDLKQLKPYGKDLVCSTACLGGLLAREKNYDKCVGYIKEFKEVFGDGFFLELEAHSSQDQIEYNQKLMKLSIDTNTPYIITNDNHYTTKEDQEVHAKFISINRDNADTENLEEIYEDCYLHSIDEMYEIMSKSGLSENEVTIGLQNTVKMSNMCDAKIEFGNPILPKLKIPKEFNSEVEYFQYLLMEGWKERILNRVDNDFYIDEYGNKHSIKKYLDRLREEFDVMNDMGFLGYHLIVAEYMNWAKDSDIPVGFGRGSGSGSFINYLLGITNIEPIANGLLFSRYLNVERVSNPDIDSDFASRDRYKIFEHLTDVYGDKYVAQIINFSYITPKVAIKDAGRILLKPIKDMEFLSDFMVDDSIEKSIENNITNEKLRSLILTHQDVIDLAIKFQNRPRNLSTNACGSVISSKPISDYCGMLMGDEGEQLLQVDKVICEELGMVKVDILGLKTLDIIEDTMLKIGKTYKDIDKIPLDDKETYNFMAKGNLSGVFQLEGNNMTKFFMKLKPKNLEDVCAGISLYRPGAMQYIDNYLDWKEDNSKIVYKSPLQENALKSTHGCMVYQENVQQILGDLAGFSYAQGDVVRRGMCKKIEKYVLEQKDNFIYGNKEMNIKGCINNGIEEEVANELFEEMTAFSNYGFNKSHGFSYGKKTYFTAYLKCHYPLEFMGSLLSHTTDTTKISKYLTDCIDIGLKISPPDINNSELGFKVFNNSILYGIGSLNQVGKPTVAQIVKNRPYSSFEDFLQKNTNHYEEKKKQSKKKGVEIEITNEKSDKVDIDKSALLSLIASGCFDNIPMENGGEIVSRDLLSGKVFLNITDKISKVSTSNIQEIFDNDLIDKNYFSLEKDYYDLHKILLTKKFKLDLMKDDALVVRFTNSYNENYYEQDDKFLIINRKMYDKKYDENLKELKLNFKENSETYAKQINKIRVIKAFVEYKGDNEDSDLEFKSTSFYFGNSWLTTAKEKYDVDDFNDFEDLDMAVEGYYKKQKLGYIVGTLIGKKKLYNEITLLTNNGCVTCKLGKLLYSTIASDLKRCDKIVVSGFRGDNNFRVTYYELGKSNPLKALKVLE